MRLPFSDAHVALGIGAVASLLALPTLAHVGVPLGGGVAIGVCILGPILAWSAVKTGTLLGVWLPLMRTFSKFAVVGGLSTLLELCILNILFFLTGLNAGIAYALFKAVTFCIALGNSYLLNKSWSFASHGESVSLEFSRFFLVNVFGIVINVSTASFVVNIVPSPLGITGVIWGNIGALAAVGVTMVWNFTMYRLVVFKVYE